MFLLTKLSVLFFCFDAGDPEKISLHKELVRSETFQLGKLNKSGNKRGIRTTKLSSRILNYALGLAHNLGKTNYEKEAALRSLPCWSTLTKYVGNNSISSMYVYF